MTPTQHCQSCRHLGKAEGHGHCALLILAPKRFCEHNTCEPVARTAARMNYVIDRYPSAALRKGTP